MATESLFGHLVTRFGRRPENLATEALAYVLNRSTAAKQAFLRYLVRAAIELPGDLGHQAQSRGSDGAIPDIVGVDGEQRRVLAVEAKFWAGLTANQPVAYLKELPEGVNSILLVIAPAMRLPTLTAELAGRCTAAGVELGKPSEPGSELVVRQITQKQHMIVASWGSVLSCVLEALVGQGEHMVDDPWPRLQVLLNGRGTPIAARSGGSAEGTTQR